jgi:hypothetical protein
MRVSVTTRRFVGSLDEDSMEEDGVIGREPAVRRCDRHPRPPASTRSQSYLVE